MRVVRILLFILCYPFVVYSFTAIETPVSPYSVNLQTGQWNATHTLLNLRGPLPVSIYLINEEEGKGRLRNGWRIAYTSLIGDDEVSLRTGGLKVQPEYDTYDRLLILRVTNASGTKVYNYVKLNYLNDRVELESLDGQNAALYFESVRSPHLIKIISAAAPEIAYTYSGDLVLSRTVGEEPPLVNEYEDDKIVSQKIGDTIVACYTYEPDATIAYDREKKSIYRWNEEKSLEAVETYLESLLRKEKYTWTKIKDKNYLSSRTLSDSTGSIHSQERYEYDSQGNKVKDILVGNLRGDEAGDPDTYSVVYVYSDEQRLIKKIEDNDLITLYQYVPGTDLLSAKYICEGDKITIRYGYTYSPDGLIETSIYDDGTSTDLHDLAGVTERHIVNLSVNLLGVPDYVEEKIEDAAGNTKTVKTTIYTYNERGLPVQQEVADAQGTIRLSTMTHYDEKGRVNFIEDSSGKTKATSYDIYNNLTWEYNGAEEKEYTYESGKLVRLSHKGKEGHNILTNYRYDTYGNKTVEEVLGNETIHSYDDLGRVTSTLYPKTFDEEGQTVQAVVLFAYDAFDRLVTTTDARGFSTHFKYNSRGKPTHILYPDQSEEKFTYYPNGLLKEEISKQGIKTCYHYDFLGRVDEKKIYSPEGNLLRTSSTSYNSFHKSAEVDELGRMSVYDYNREGQLISSLITLDGCEQKKDFSYDEFGTLRETKIWYGQGKKAYTSIITERDVNNQVVHQQVKDHLGKTLISTPRAHPKENNTLRHHDTDYTNELNQKVLRLTEIDESGTATIITFDALGREISYTLKNSAGEILTDIQKKYDLAGNLAWQKEQDYVLTWTYDSLNRVETRTESSPGIQKTYKYTYSLSGELETVTKPDGVILVYEYDEMGHLTALFSSDSSVSYQYSYDAQGNLCSIKDIAARKEVKRSMNSFGKIVDESLDDEIRLHNSYDNQGRRTCLELFDGSSVVYEYDAAFLKSVTKLSKGNELYKHEYQAHDKSGRLISSKLIGDTGTAMYSWDVKGRNNAIATNYWFETLDFNEKGQPERALTTVCYAQEEYSLSYDEKGQLRQESGQQQNIYTYDTIYNRLQHNHSSYAVNGINQLLQCDDTQYVYDANGNLIEKIGAAARVLYRYDAMDRLVEYVSPNTMRVVYTYDGLHRRLTKDVYAWDKKKAFWDTPEQYRFVYDGDNEVGLVDKKGAVLEWRTLGTGLGAELGAAVAIELKGKTFVPIHDYRGCVRCLIDKDTGLVEEYYYYSGFGEEKVFDSTGAELESSINPWRFSSKRHDAESKLVFYGKRYYDAAIGRWTTPDPIGHSDHTNTYAFVHNDPMTQSDLYGLYSIDTFTSTMQDLWSDLKSFFTYQFDYITQREDVDFFDLERMGKNLIGPTLFTISGYYAEHPFGGVYGHGEFNDKKRITFINGILNDKVFLETTLEMISKTHGGSNIHYTYRASQGWTKDFLRCVFIKLGFVSSDARRLAFTWKRLIEEMGGPGKGGVIIHYAHSIGGTETASARSFLTQEEQQMVRVITFGSATLVPDGGFKSVINIVSWHDGVCYFDPWHYALALFGWQTNVIFIDAREDSWPMCDHTLSDYWNRWLTLHLDDFYRQVYSSNI